MISTRILIPRLQEPFITLIEVYMKKYSLKKNEFSKFVGIRVDTISHLINKKNDGKYKCKLSAEYIKRCLEKGVFKMDEIYDGQPETEKEAAFWNDMKKRERILELIDEIERRKGDPIMPLEVYLSGLKTNR